MEKRSFMRVDEVAAELGVSKSYAYKIVQRLNAELRQYRTIPVRRLRSRNFRQIV